METVLLKLTYWQLNRQAKVPFPTNYTTVEVDNKGLFGRPKIVPYPYEVCKWQIGHRKWFLDTNLFLIKPFLITKFDCTNNSSFCFSGSK